MCESRWVDEVAEPGKDASLLTCLHGSTASNYAASEGGVRHPHRDGHIVGERHDRLPVRPVAAKAVDFRRTHATKRHSSFGRPHADSRRQSPRFACARGTKIGPCCGSNQSPRLGVSSGHQVRSEFKGQIVSRPRCRGEERLDSRFRGISGALGHKVREATCKPEGPETQ